jgi:hypothetical protein
MLTANAQHQQHLPALHEKAQLHLSTKPTKVTKHMFPKPSIEDIYGDTPNAQTTRVPYDMQTHFLFDRHNDIARTGRTKLHNWYCNKVSLF